MIPSSLSPSRLLDESRVGSPSLRGWLAGPLAIGALLLSILSPLSAADPAPEAKPNLWIYTDMSDPRNQRAGGHPYNDPDDICALAGLLLQANRFHIRAVVFSSNSRIGLADATPFVRETFAAAYAHDRPFLERSLGGFQPSISFRRSSINRDGKPRKFDPADDYRGLSGLETVRDLVELAGRERVYVLNWGPLIESAMVVRHCLTTANLKALENLTIISHWTMSNIDLKFPSEPYRVANCSDDARACAYLHETAREHPNVKFVELGSIGQSGLVYGTGGYPYFASFQGSRLGQILLHAKFYHGKPDFSDGATYWVLVDGFGPHLRDFVQDGSLEQDAEVQMRDRFRTSAHHILEDLRRRSDVAAEASAPFPAEFIVDRFTYVYRFLDGRFWVYLPYDGRYEMLDSSGRLVQEAEVAFGVHELDMSALPAGTYTVRVTCSGVGRVFTLEVPAR